MISDTNYFNEKKTILEQLIAHGVQNLAPFFEKLLNEAMRIEREMALKAAPYERSPERVIRIGEITMSGTFPLRGKCRATGMSLN